MQRHTYYLQVHETALASVDQWTEEELITFVNNNRIRERETFIRYYRHIIIDNNEGKIIEDSEEDLAKDIITSDVTGSNPVIKKAVSLSETIRKIRSGYFSL
jgi:hypothetical protein